MKWNWKSVQSVKCTMYVEQEAWGVRSPCKLETKVGEKEADGNFPCNGSTTYKTRVSPCLHTINYECELQKKRNCKLHIQNTKYTGTMYYIHTLPIYWRNKYKKQAPCTSIQHLYNIYMLCTVSMYIYFNIDYTYIFAHVQMLYKIP